MNKAKPMTKGKISENRGEFTDMFIFMMKQDTIRKLEKLKTTLINRMCYPNKPVNTFENAREQKEVIKEEFEEVIKELKEGGKEE